MFAGQMTLWGNRDKDSRECWRILEESIFLQWKDTTANKIKGREGEVGV